jgi:6-phosphofructokinase 1
MTEQTSAAQPVRARIGVLTSRWRRPGHERGGPGRGAHRHRHADAEVYGIYEGWQGAVDGGDFRSGPCDWDDVSGIMILHRGGTVIGTARCAAFRTARAAAPRRST